MSHALLVLGGAPFTAPLLRWAREAGLDAVLAAADPHTPLRRAAAEFHSIPADDAEAHAALARRLAKDGRLAGVYAADARAFALLPAVAAAVPSLLASRRVLELLLRPGETRARLAASGLALANGPASDERELDAFAFFRDGAFVPGGLALRQRLASGDVTSVQPCGLAPELERDAYRLVERAARILGFERGPLQATLRAGPDGLVLAALHPGIVDALGASHVARLAYGKSPLQAWLAHLAGAGGPFDELALAPRAAAGWISLAPARAGRFAGVDGLTRARALPGLVDAWIEEPGRELGSPEIEERPLGYLWAEGRDGNELEDRLRAARAALEVRVACRQRVA